MSREVKFSIAAILLASTSVYAEHDSDTTKKKSVQQKQDDPNIVQLNPIQIKAKDSFDKIGAVSEKKLEVFGQDLNEVIRSIPGSFTQHDIGQGGISVNLRGLEGIGRVNTTIDGVSQTFFQAAPHGYNGSSTYIDENFIAAVDIEKGAVTGTQGANALAGAANFRTLSVNDLLQEGQTIGGSAVYRMGSNGYGKNAMLSSALRRDLAENGSIGFLLAVSGKNKYGYKNGAGEQVASDDFDSEVPVESGVQARSIMSKIELSPNQDHKLVLSYLGNRSEFSNNHSPLRVTNQLGIFEYVFDPLSDLLKLKVNASYGLAKQEHVTSAENSGNYTGRSSKNPAMSFSLVNQSYFEFAKSEVTLDYGLKLMHSEYQSSEASQQDLYQLGLDDVNYFMHGEQSVQSYFTDLQWQWHNLTLNAGLRHERYQNQGYIPPTEDNGALVFPAGGNVNFKTDKSYTNPSLQLGYQLFDGLQLYASYAYSSRGPNVNEVMYASNPNNPYSINPYLKPERAQNRDIGFNLMQSDLFVAQDVLRLKFNYFNNRIKNYIAQNQFYVCNDVDLMRCDIDAYMQNGAENFDPIGIYTNTVDTSTIKGYELEVNYDFMRGYLNFSYTHTDSTIPLDYLADMGFSHVTQLPSSYWNIDLGTRWLNNTLVLGSRISYTGKDTVAAGVDSDSDKQLHTRLQASPKLIELYAKYSINRNIVVFANVENLTNQIYNYALSGGTLATGNSGSNTSEWANQGTGRGRTYYGGISIKF